LYQLISGQLDMDRLDYLSRDSFFTGVIEGQVGAERIIHMLNVREDELVVEEKGIYSIEKFIIARRLMYWQVYLHKTVVAADILLINIMKRARAISKVEDFKDISKSLKYFLNNEIDLNQLSVDDQSIQHFINLDDADIICAIKSWQHADDKVLRSLSLNFLNRNLPKVELSPKPFASEYIEKCQNQSLKKYKIEPGDAAYFINSGVLKNDAYLVDKYNSIKVLRKNNEVVDVTDASDNYNLKALKSTVKKYYLCFYR
jgi:HD superfamily phosphohydrolase